MVFHNLNANIKFLTDNLNVYNGILEFIKILKKFFLNNSQHFYLFLFTNHNNNFFNKNKIKKINVFFQYEYIKIYKLSTTKYLFSFYDDNFIIYSNLKKNIFFGFIKNPEKYAAQFFDNFLLQPIFYFWLKKRKKYFFHSALLSYNDKGILIIGETGRGKSTLTFLLLSLLKNKAKYFSDDKTILFEKNEKIFGFGLPTLLKIKNSKLKEIKNFINNFKVAFKVKDSKYLWLESEDSEVNIKYVLFPQITNKKSFFKKLDYSDFFHHIIKNTYTLNCIENIKKYIDFLSKLVNGTTAFEIYLGKDMNMCLKKFLKQLK